MYPRHRSRDAGFSIQIKDLNRKFAYVVSSMACYIIACGVDLKDFASIIVLKT
jgi:hypothetical protein